MVLGRADSRSRCTFSLLAARLAATDRCFRSGPATPRGMPARYSRPMRALDPRRIGGVPAPGGLLALYGGSCRSAVRTARAISAGRRRVHLTADASSVPHGDYRAPVLPSAPPRSAPRPRRGATFARRTDGRTRQARPWRSGPRGPRRRPSPRAPRRGPSTPARCSGACPAVGGPRRARHGRRASAHWGQGRRCGLRRGVAGGAGARIKGASGVEPCTPTRRASRVLRRTRACRQAYVWAGADHSQKSPTLLGP